MMKRKNTVPALVSVLDLKHDIQAKQQELTAVETTLTKLIAEEVDQGHVPTYVVKGRRLYNTSTQEVTGFLECKKHERRPLTRKEQRLLMQYRVETMAQMRLEGKGWAEIADTFNYRRGDKVHRSTLAMMAYRHAAKALNIPLVRKPKKQKAAPTATTTVTKGRTAFSEKSLGRKGRANA